VTVRQFIRTSDFRFQSPQNRQSEFLAMGRWSCWRSTCGRKDRRNRNWSARRIGKPETDDFFHYLAPFPNLPPLQADLRFYLDHGVKGIFMQGDGNSPGGDFAELKAWLIARLLWNPKPEMADARWEFPRGVGRIREFI